MSNRHSLQGHGAAQLLILCGIKYAGMSQWHALDPSQSMILHNVYYFRNYPIFLQNHAEFLLRSGCKMGWIMYHINSLTFTIGFKTLEQVLKIGPYGVQNLSSVVHTNVKAHDVLER